MTVKSKTAVADVWSDVRPGDLVHLRRLPHMGSVGFVFDIVGDVVRLWNPQADEVDVEGLMPFQRSELALTHRYEAYLLVRYTGPLGSSPYVFVCADSRARILDAERSFTNAGDYTIVESHFGSEVASGEDDEGGEHGEDTASAAGPVGD